MRAGQATKNEPSSSLFIKPPSFLANNARSYHKTGHGRDRAGQRPARRAHVQGDQREPQGAPAVLRRPCPLLCARLPPPAAAQPLPTLPNPHTPPPHPLLKQTQPKPYRPPALSCSTAATWRWTPTCRGGTRSTPTRGAWPVRRAPPPCFALFELLCRLLLAPLTLEPLCPPCFDLGNSPYSPTPTQPPPLPQTSARPSSAAR
jgi:hypothetical protein